MPTNKNSPIPELKIPTTIPDNKISLVNEWPYRLLGNGLIIGIILFLASITITIKTDLINKQLLSLKDSFFLMTSELGFTLDDIIVEGRKHTGKEELLAQSGLNRHSNILEIDLYELKRRIEELPWVKQARIRRSYSPNVIQISLKEHEVKSLWQHQEKFYPISEEGKVIEAPYTPDKPLLLIVGDNAPEHINELLSELDTGSEIFQRIRVAHYISNRRWNLILDDISNGITIKLPAQGVKEAWKKLLKLNKSKNILKRKLTNIDLRLKGKVIVKLEKSDSAAAKKRKAKESKI